MGIGLGMHELLQRVVRLHGVRVGHVVDVILDSTEGKPMGLEVRCEDGKHRFLPMAAASLLGDEVVVESPFALLDAGELEFYRARGIPVRSRREPAA
jgi:sporulation protein YlmC with PRC-barrel domain